MNRYGRYVALGLTVLAGVWLADARGQVAGDKKEPWQAILTKEVYKELVKREATKIKEILDGKADEEGLHRAAFGAVLIAAYTKSVKDAKGEDLDGTFATATALLKAITEKGGVEKAKKLTANLLAGNTKNAGPAPVKDLAGLVDRADLMEHFRTLAKGGDGMHPDLQNNIKFKGAQNGIEEKIRYLSLKELSATGMKKESKELELLGYRTAVVGSLTYLYAPPQKMAMKDPSDWKRYAVTMRDSSADLAAAAAKSDVAGVFKAANSLNSSCSQCHSMFRN